MGGGATIKQVGRDYGLGKTRFEKEPNYLPDYGGIHIDGGDGMPLGHHLQSIGDRVLHRESIESVEDMIARCLAGESAPQVVESVLYGRK